MEHILVVEDNKGKRTIILKAATYSLGREESNSIVLESPWISRHHATLLRLTTGTNSQHFFRLIDGDWQGKRSTNGIKVNGSDCFERDLVHKDEIFFGKEVRARYYTVETQEKNRMLALKNSAENSSFLSKIENPCQTLSSLNNEENLTQLALQRLASFPELISKPILEINTNGQITYLNPKAIEIFPDIRKQKLDHPVLDGLMNLLKPEQEQTLTREIQVGRTIFEQYIHYIPSSELIRSYLIDITKHKLAEEALQKTTMLQRAILDSANYMIFSTDLKGTIQTFNKAAELHLQYSAQQIVGQANVVQFYPEEEIERIAVELMQETGKKLLPCFEVLTAKAREKKSHETESVYLRKDGTSFPVLVSLTALQDINNNITGFLLVSNDITERKEAELIVKQARDRLELRVEERTAELKQINQKLLEEVEERKRTEQALYNSIATNRALLNAIPDWMFRIDKNGYLVNFKAPKNTHPPLLQQEFLNKQIQEVLPLEIASSMMNHIKQALENKEVQIFEYELFNCNKQRIYEARIAISSENEVMVIIRDITKRKKIETEMRNALTKEKELNELKSRFISMTSHEFRTPLATILSSSELLEHYSHKWTEEKQNFHLHRIQTAVHHMTGLLNDVLLLGKAEAGKLNFKPKTIELNQFCEELVEEIQFTTKTHQILFTSNQSSINREVDEKLLRQILNNLLSNAIKYSPESNEVNLDLIDRKEEVILKVKDCGIGIPQDEQDRLFDSFHRANNVGDISGTGLGLAIVKKAVELHKGRIEVESILNAGTTFTIALPVQVKKTL